MTGECTSDTEKDRRPGSALVMSLCPYDIYCVYSLPLVGSEYDWFGLIVSGVLLLLSGLVWAFMTSIFLF